MKINNLYEIHFSPTGGTKEAVDVFSAQWNIPKSIIDLADMSVEFDKYEFYGDDLCVIGVPSFGGRVPAVAIQRIRQLKANNTPAIIIATYGNRNYDDTLVELQESVENVGFCVVAALAVVTQHSIFPQIATGRPDATDKSKLAEMSIKVKVHIERANGFNKAKLSGENRQYKEYKGIPLKPITSNKCMKCGICANNCPVGAIPLDNPKVTDNEKCISCMRCVRRCPKGARKISELKSSMILMKIKKECQERKDIEIFINKNISTNTENKENKEIKDKNNLIYNITETNMTLEGIEEISVSDFALEDAKMDINDIGIPTEDKEKLKSIEKQKSIEKKTNVEKKINVQEKIEYIEKLFNGEGDTNEKKQSLPNTLADMNNLFNREPKPLKEKKKTKEDLIDEDELEDSLELEEIRDEYNDVQVEDPKDFILNISSELEDIIVDEESVDKTEEIEDILGIILEDK